MLANTITIEKEELKKLAMLCKICYTATSPYIAKTTEEAMMFNEISDDIIKIDSKLEHVQAISTLSVDNNTLYIVVAGSDDISDFISNLDLNQVSFNDLSCDNSHDISNNISDNLALGTEPVKFHNGFYKQFQSLIESIDIIINKFVNNNGNHIVFTGHSTGGCVVSIIAFYLYYKKTTYIDIHIVTFGSPIFTNDYGAFWFSNNTKYIRVVNTKDPIPRLPWFNENNPYKHIQYNYIQLDRQSILLNMPDNVKSSKLSKLSKLSCFRFLKSLFTKKLNLSWHSIDSYISNISNFDFSHL